MKGMQHVCACCFLVQIVTGKCCVSHYKHANKIDYVLCQQASKAKKVKAYSDDDLSDSQDEFDAKPKVDTSDWSLSEPLHGACA